MKFKKCKKIRLDEDLTIIDRIILEPYEDNK